MLLSLSNTIVDAECFEVGCAASSMRVGVGGGGRVGEMRLIGIVCVRLW